MNKQTTNNLKYICIEGNIGSGKSTLAKALAKQLQAIYLPEAFEENELLPLFYKDARQFGFPLEYSFLINRFNQIKQALPTKGPGTNVPNKLIIADYSIYKCLWFAKINLSKRDFIFFEKHFNAILNELPKPDIIIHLTTDIKNLKQNIKKRCRTYEQTLTTEYLKQIEKQYTKGIKKIKVNNILEININTYSTTLIKDTLKFIDGFLKDLNK